MIKKRNEIPLYDKKIQELHSEVESLACSVSEKGGELSKITSELTASEKRLVQLNAEVSLKETHLANLDGMISRQEAKITDLNESSAKKEGEHQEKVREHSEKLDTIGRSLKIHEQKVGEYKEILSQVSALEDKRKFLNDELTRLEGELKEKSLAISLESDELDKKRNEVRDEIEKNGKILSDITVRKGEVENWVRTLQRYYTETGINMNILPLFGLTKEGNC